MEDRYLYRAKRTDNGEWVEGSLIVRRGTARAFIVDVKNITALRSVTTHCSDKFDWRSVEVDPSTICQCTGLKGKNGKLIWENDILLGYLDDSYPEDATYAEVLWWRSGFYTRERGSNDVHEIDAFTEQNYEVIGNIFDNPELLEPELLEVEHE